VAVVTGLGGCRSTATVEPPTATRRAEKGRRVFEFEHLVSNKAVLDGAPLCRVNQRLVITPTGEIHVTYDCEWVRTVRWDSFLILMIFGKESCPGREYMAVAGERVFAGTLTKGPVSECRLRSIAFDQLTVRPEVGPCHVVWHEEANGTFTWSSGINLSFTPPAVPRRDFVYAGQRARLAYSILLPVSQQ